MFAKLKDIYRDPRAWPPLEEEMGGFRQFFKGKVLNAGSGGRDISSLVDGRLYNQDLAYGPDAEYGKNLDFTGPIHEIPVEDAFFDAVICNAVLEHVPNPGEAMNEFNRILKPGGCLYLCAPFLQPEHKCPGDFQRWTLDGLKKLAAEHGFKVERAEPVHTLYHTLAWILWDWLRDDRRPICRLLKLVLFPLLRLGCARGKRIVSTLASGCRVLARKPLRQDPPDTKTAAPAPQK